MFDEEQIRNQRLIGTGRLVKTARIEHEWY